MTDRILRIAAIRNNRIVFDQAFISIAPVTIGRDPECTVILSGHAPIRHELFAAANGRYTLRLIGVMEARVKRNDSILQVSGATEVSLLSTDRGIVYLGEPGVRIMFEFVRPPPRRGALNLLHRTLAFLKP